MCVVWRIGGGIQRNWLRHKSAHIYLCAHVCGVCACVSMSRLSKKHPQPPHAHALDTRNQLSGESANANGALSHRLTTTTTTERDRVECDFWTDGMDAAGCSVGLVDGVGWGWGGGGAVGVRTHALHTLEFDRRCIICLTSEQCRKCV